jgi:hypothetical protein
MEDKKKLFYYLDNIYIKKEIPDDSEIRSLVWPINRFLSMEKDLLKEVAELSKYMFTLGAQYYKLLLRVVPKLNRSPRNKYIKVEKEVDDDLLDRYTQYFQLSRREVRDYLKILFKQRSKKEIYEFVGLEAK